MNRTDIAHQVSLTLGDSIDSFDMDAILDDLAEAGVADSVDDIDSDAYWEIVRSHDTGAQAEEKAEKAHADYLKAEAAYKQATVARQVAFAHAIDAMGRGGNAILSRKLGLSAPTVKSIADRGRGRLLAATDIIDFYNGSDDLLVMVTETGAYITLDHGDLAGRTDAYGSSTTQEGAEVVVLLERETIDAGEWFADALDEDGNLTPDTAAEMAAIINNDAGIYRRLSDAQSIA